MKKAILFLLMLFVLGSAYAVNLDDVNSVEIEPGRTGLINFDVENEHDFDVVDVSVILDLSGDVPIAPYQDSAEVFFGELNDGEDESATFRVIASADANLGLYKIPVLISYSDEDGNQFAKVNYISVLITSKPDISVFLDEPNYILGANSEISVQVVNRGLSDAQFLSIELLNSDFYDVISMDEVYIGDLDSDDFDSADFSLSLNYPLPTRVTIPVEISYYDSNNNFYTEDFVLRADVYTMEQAQKLGLVATPDYTWVVVIVGLVVLFIAYRIIRSIRKRRKR
jgi:hypothetical protein